MRPIIEGPPEPGSPPLALWRRLAWFAALAAGAGAAVMLLAWTLEAVLPR